MMDEDRIREAIDACRPDGRELELPELAPLAREMIARPELLARLRNSQELDRHVGRAFRAVEVPSDLAGRILAALEVAAPASSSPDSVVMQAPSRPNYQTAWRKPRVWASVMLAAGLMLAVTAYLLRPQGDFSHDTIVERTNEFFTGQPTVALKAGLPPRAYVVPVSLTGSTQVSWGNTQFLERRGVLVRLVGRRTSASLVIVPLRGAPRIDPTLPKTPPQAPSYTTGKLAIGMWQSRGFLYVLTVEGDARDYRGMLFETGAVAMR